MLDLVLDLGLDLVLDLGLYLVLDLGLDYHLHHLFYLLQDHLLLVPLFPLSILSPFINFSCTFTFTIYLFSCRVLSSPFSLFCYIYIYYIYINYLLYIVCICI